VTRAGGADRQLPGDGADAADFADVECAACRTPGVRLFTILAWVDDRAALHRVYSNMPQTYPLSGEKVMPRGAPWIGQVVIAQRPYLGRDAAAVAAVFSDHALIASLGCGAVINLPVVDGGRTLGVLNLFAAEDAYDEESLTAALPLAVYSVPALRRWHAGTGRRSLT